MVCRCLGSWTFRLGGAHVGARMVSMLLKDFRQGFTRMEYSLGEVKILQSRKRSGAGFGGLTVWKAIIVDGVQKRYVT